MFYIWPLLYTTLAHPFAGSEGCLFSERPNLHTPWLYFVHDYTIDSIPSNPFLLPIMQIHSILF